MCLIKFITYNVMKKFVFNACFELFELSSRISGVCDRRQISIASDLLLSSTAEPLKWRQDPGKR